MNENGDRQTFKDRAPIWMMVIGYAGFAVLCPRYDSSVMQALGYVCIMGFVWAGKMLIDETPRY